VRAVEDEEPAVVGRVRRVGLEAREARAEEAREAAEAVRGQDAVVEERLPRGGAVDLVGARRRREEQLVLRIVVGRRDGQRGARYVPRRRYAAELERARGAAARALVEGLDFRGLVPVKPLGFGRARFETVRWRRTGAPRRRRGALPADDSRGAGLVAAPVERALGRRALEQPAHRLAQRFRTNDR